jgi:ubiquinone/menaquinone biosynthesis C-methylase UbiE
MINLDSSKLINGVYYLSTQDNQPFNESLYISLRKKEGRLYSDEEVKYLPKVKSVHPLKKEWEIRSRTLQNLIKYFSNYEGLNILEIGCGNGWLSNGISVKTNNFLVGMDLNQIELTQAARVFNHNKNLKFVYGNIFENIFRDQIFDCLIFASSIQYFPDLRKLINRVFTVLKPNGEIHIVDSNFYHEKDLGEAKQRTENYYNKSGFPEMCTQYYHHRWNDLNKFDYKISGSHQKLFDKIKNFIPGTKSFSFPWVVIKNSGL